MTSEKNPELRDLKTHQAGATTLHETRHADHPMQIEPAGAPGMIDDEDEDNRYIVTKCEEEGE